MSRWSRFLSRPVASRSAPVRRRLMLNALEDRCVPAVFTVVNTLDAGGGSLRQAVIAANNLAGADSIDFDPATFSSAKTITLTTGELVVTDSVTVTGPGPGLLTVNANNNSRIFNTSSAPAATPIGISGMTLTGGKTANSGGAVFGSDEAISLANCVLTGNTANYGGAVYLAAGGSLTAIDSNFLNNSATTHVGAIMVPGIGAKTVLIRCTVSGNTAYYNGAGLYARNYLLIDSSTVSGNMATNGSSGGVLAGGPFAAGALTIRNSTISGNTAGKYGGGGVSLYNLTGTLVVQNSTITGNSAAGDGGGIYFYSGGGGISLESTIVQGNTASNGPDIKTAKTIACSNCAIGSISGITTFSDLGGNLIGNPNLKLGPLADNGGPTMTHALLTGSAAIDAGSNPAAVTFDQRGKGFVRTAGGKVDIGAFEHQRIFVVTTDADSGPGSLRQMILDTNAILGADTITFDPAFFATAKTISLTSGEIQIANAVSINGPGPSLVTVSGNNASRVFNASAAATGAVIVFEGLTLTGGKAADHGGAIRIGDESVTLRNCVLVGNEATTDGGAVAIGAPGAAKLLMEDSIISGNSAGRDGGAIYGGFGGTSITIRRSTISGNIATRNGGGASASGYAAFLIEDSTVSGNQANGIGGGGGIMIAGPNAAGALVVRNSTISSNTTLGNGGGLLALATRSGVIIENSTITGNTAEGSKGGGGIAGTGVTHPYYGYYGSKLSLESCIVSGNTATANSNQDLFDGYLFTGAVTAKFSAIGSSAGVAKFSPDAATIALLGADFKLGPLAFNGGPTKTHALLVASPCIGAGSNPSALAFDQRGAGFVRTSGAQTDIGAYENQLNLVVITADDSGPGSLRQAIIDANAIPGTDTITFDPVFFATAKTITLTGGELSISDAVNIVGPSAELTLDAGGTSRLFNTIDAPNNAAISMSRLNLANGNAGASNGGGIVVGDEALSLNQVTISNCTTSNDGGGIYTTGQKLELSRVTITNCKANHEGGGIFAQAGGVTVTLADCAIAGNTGELLGGGIWLQGGTLSSGSLNMVRSTVSNNLAKGGGAGIAIRLGGFSIAECTISDNTAGNGIYSPIGGGIDVNAVSSLIPPPPSSIINSTLSNNRATSPSGYGYGGAIAFYQGNASLTISNCTITGNMAPEAAGGLYVSSSTKFMLSSSIVAGNVSDAVGAIGSDIIFINGTIQGTNNIVGIADDGSFTLQPGNQTGTKAAPLDAKLGPLADNGGPTKTHALLPGSPGINAGSNPAFLITDQRGKPRVIGSIDIGAFELQPAAKVSNLVVGDGTNQRSIVTQLQITFDSPVVFTGAPSSAFSLVRQIDSKAVNLAAAVDATNTIVTLTFTGGAVDNKSLADGRYTFNVLADQFGAGGFDGNGDSTGGDDYVLVGSPGTAPNLFRLFGDFNGDGTVAANDFIQFRLALGGNNPIFDFDGDGAVAASDFIQFRLRFGGSI